jgi:hypothetical protein
MAAINPPGAPPPVITVSTMRMKRAMEQMLKDYHIETMTCVVDPVQLPHTSPIVYNTSHLRTRAWRRSDKNLRLGAFLQPYTKSVADTFASTSSTLSQVDKILGAQAHHLNGTSDFHRDGLRYGLDLADTFTETDPPILPVPLANPSNSPALHNMTRVDRRHSDLYP